MWRFTRRVSQVQRNKCRLKQHGSQISPMLGFPVFVVSLGLQSCTCVVVPFSRSTVGRGQGHESWVCCVGARARWTTERACFDSSKQLQRRCRKKHYENIHDRFIRVKFFRKTMIELGRSEEILLEMDRLASEDHSATEEEIDVYRGNWWIRSNVVNFDTIPTRHRPDFKKALSTLHRLKKAEDKAHYENWSQSSSSWWQWQTTWWHLL